MVYHSGPWNIQGSAIPKFLGKHPLFGYFAIFYKKERLMSFPDPLVVTVNAIAQSMAMNDASKPYSKSYKKDDDSYSAVVSHTYGKRTRSTYRLNQKKFTPDPFIPAQNMQVSASVYLVVDRPITGMTNAELKLMVEGFCASLTATSGANIVKLLAGES